MSSEKFYARNEIIGNLQINTMELLIYIHVVTLFAFKYESSDTDTEVILVGF